MTEEQEYELSLEAQGEDGGPSRPLRFLPPGRWVVEVTTRTIQGRFLRLPHREANAIVKGVIGRANHLFPNVRIIGYWFLSNHWEALLEVPNSATLSAFMNHVNANLARLLGHLYDWPEKFWSRRYRGIVIVGPRAQIRRLRYLLSQGPKENLVALPSEWPGVNCLRGITVGALEFGVWFDGTKEYLSRKRALKRGKTPKPRSAFEATYEIRLHPLPCWSKLTVEERQSRARELVSGIEDEARTRRRTTGKAPLGVLAILRQKPDHRPKHVASSPAPLVHASSKWERRWFNDHYYSFLRRFREASSRFLAGEPSAINAFPSRCFLPRPPVGLRLQIAEPPASTSAR